MKPQLELGGIQSNLLVVPLLQTEEQAQRLTVMGAREAVERGQMRIRETGTVERLTIEVIGDVPVLIPESEVLSGGGQNRTVTTSLLLRQGEHQVPVRCVERHRWQPHTERVFRSADFGLPFSVRREKVRTGFQAFERTGRFEPDQGRLWASIHDNLHRAGIRHATEDVSALYTSRREQVEKLLKTFPRQPNQVGVMVFVYGNLVGVEWMATPELWRSYHEAILRSYLLGVGSGVEPRTLSASAISDLLEEIWNRAWAAEATRPAAGSGELHIFSYGSLRGTLLADREQPIQLSVLA
jgi:hypothetical protein